MSDLLLWQYFNFVESFDLEAMKTPWETENIIKKWNNIIAYQPKYVLNIIKANAAMFVFPKSTGLLTNWNSVLMMHISFANICFSVLFVGLFFDLLWNEIVTAKDYDDDK